MRKMLCPYCGSSDVLQAIDIASYGRCKNSWQITATPDAPVAPTSADVLTVPSGHDPEWQPDLDEEWQKILAMLPAIREKKHDWYVLVGKKDRDLLSDLFAIVCGQEDIIKGLTAERARLTASNVTLQAQNAGLAETMQHIAVKVREVALEEGMPDAHTKTLWDLGADLIRIAQKPAPNGGETAADLAPVTVLEPAASYVVYDGTAYGPFWNFTHAMAYRQQYYKNGVVRDGSSKEVKSCKTFVNPAETKNGPTPDLLTRLNSDTPRTIDRSEIGTAVDLVKSGQVQPRDGVDFVTMPEPPATALKLSSVKLTAAQRRLLACLVENSLHLQTIRGNTWITNGASYSMQPFQRTHYRAFAGFLKNAGELGYIVTFYEANGQRHEVTDAGRAALAARESEAGK